MAKNPFTSGSEYRAGADLGKLKSNVEWSDSKATSKGKNPYDCGCGEYRVGVGDMSPGSTRWNMGEGSVNKVKKPGS